MGVEKFYRPEIEPPDRAKPVWESNLGTLAASQEKGQRHGSRNLLPGLEGNPVSTSAWFPKSPKRNGRGERI